MRPTPSSHERRRVSREAAEGELSSALEELEEERLLAVQEDGRDTRRVHV
jgi:hypothetical protein